MKKILITGGAGFIGYHLANHLSKNNNNFIYIFDNLSRGRMDNNFKKLILRKNVKFYKIDLLRNIKFKIKDINTTYHLAAKVGVANVNKSPSETININILSLINTLKFLKKNSSNSKFIFFSTSEVYSPLIFNKISKQPYSEKENLIFDNSIKSRDSYYISKLFGEKYVKLSGFKFIIFRPHNIYGPRMGFSHVIPELIKKIKKFKNVKVYSPNHSRAFCYVDDAISQILFLQKKRMNEVYNIGNPREEIKIYKLANLIRGLLKSDARLTKNTITSGSPPKRCPNIKKIKKLGYNKQFTNLRRGLVNTIKWYEK